jgi:hypothetical protein
MQDKYVSLNPENAAREEGALRANLYRQRLVEAEGGQAAGLLGAQFGLTAATLTYARLQGSGFALFPLNKAGAAGVGKISFAFLAFYMLGHGFVMSKFGSKA